MFITSRYGAIDLARIGLRAGAEHGLGRVGQALAAVVGSVAGLVPTGYLDVPNGAGVVGGAYVGLAGVTACAPVWLTYLICVELAGDQECGVIRNLYLVAARLTAIRTGAVLAALKTWSRLVLVACAFGALVGLGDGLRNGDVVGASQVSVPGVALLVVVTAYVVVLGVAGCALIPSAVPVLILVTVSTLASVLLVPSATAAGAEWLLLGSPMTPLLSIVGAPVLGRFALDISDAIAVLDAAAWTAASVVVIQRRWSAAQLGRT